MRDLLLQYEQALGQAINYLKSTIFYSSNTPQNLRGGLNTTLGVHKCMDHDRYLGLPFLMGRSKRSIFSFLKTALSARLSGWDNMFLSRADKEVLLCLVA